jgi:hypothetical protein
MTSLGRPYKKYVKGDVSIRDRSKKKVCQRGLGSHRPHGTTTGLMLCLGRFTPGRETLYSLHSRLGGIQGCSGWAQKILSLPAFDPWQPIGSRYMNYAIPAHSSSG